MDINHTAEQYLNNTVFLIAGGFMIALAAEKYKLQERAAYHLMLLIGTSKRSILAGIIFITAFLSLWMHNSTAALTISPIALALADKISHSVETKKGFLL